MAFSRFLICDFSSWQLTTVLVGMCLMRTAGTLRLPIARRALTNTPARPPRFRLSTIL